MNPPFHLFIQSLSNRQKLLIHPNCTPSPAYIFRPIPYRVQLPVVVIILYGRQQVSTFAADTGIIAATHATSTNTNRWRRWSTLVEQSPPERKPPSPAMVVNRASPSTRRQIERGRRRHQDKVPHGAGGRLFVWLDACRRERSNAMRCDDRRTVRRRRPVGDRFLCTRNARETRRLILVCLCFDGKWVAPLGRRRRGGSSASTPLHAQWGAQ